MTPQGQIPPDWTFYLLGAIFILLGIAFFVLPAMARSGYLSSVRIPWIVLYTFRRDGFIFVTSPILIIISIASFLVFALRR